MNIESADMRRVDPRPDSVWDLQVGDFFFQTDDKGQRHFGCMLPGKTACIIPLRPVVTPNLNGGHYWDWDGCEDKPTLQPSINAVGSWHGWIRAGRMVSC